ASFPLALAAAAPRGEDPAGVVGRVYAANAIGAVAGWVIFSLLIIPAFGTQDAQRLLIWIAAAAAISTLAWRMAVAAVVAAAVASATIAPYFSNENYNVVNDPRVEIVYDDARHFILTTNEKFDIITSDPIHPWVKGAAALYTKEHFEQVKAHLNPGGVVTQWVPLYQST